MNTVPLRVLVNARDALRMVRDLRAGQALDANQWSQVSKAYAGLHIWLEEILKQRIEITQEAGSAV